MELVGLEFNEYNRQCAKLNFPKITERRGNLTFLQYPEQIPFEIKRVFWTYNVPSGETRGGHAYRTQHEIIIALSGSFDIVIKGIDGMDEHISMNRSFYGLYLPPLTWRYLDNFSSNAISLHISSSEFDEDDYVRDFNAINSIEK
jgi:hypothetical protein